MSEVRINSDSGKIKWGADYDIELTHNADKGLILKHTATADDKPVILTLQTGETDMAANDVMGKIEFQAPDEGTGTDAILVAAAIQAVSEGDFSSSSNATRLEFMTGSSEAATSQMTISSGGIVGIGAGVPGDLGVGLHIKTSDTGASANASGDDLVVESNTGNAGISILSANNANGGILFGDDGDDDIGQIYYEHAGNKLNFIVNAALQMTIVDDQVLVGATSSNHSFHFATNLNSEYGFYYQNDGNNANRDGLKLANGTYDGSGTNNAISFNTGNNTNQGSITFSSGTVSYNAFTASHEVSLPTNSDGDEWGTTQTEANKDGYDYGTLVKTHSIYYQKRNEGSNSTSEELQRGIRYNVSNATTAYGRDVLGVYSGKAIPRAKVDNELYVETDQEVIDGDKNVGDIKTWGSPEECQNIHYVHVLGDGHILCNNEKGNIAVGDGITCSSTAGIGMKADKTCMIIGMAQEAVTFSNSTPKLVAVQYGIRQFTPWTD